MSARSKPGTTSHALGSKISETCPGTRSLVTTARIGPCLPPSCSGSPPPTICSPRPTWCGSRSPSGSGASITGRRCCCAVRPAGASSRRSSSTTTPRPPAGSPPPSRPAWDDDLPLAVRDPGAGQRDGPGRAAGDVAGGAGPLRRAARRPRSRSPSAARRWPTTSPGSPPSATSSGRGGRVRVDANAAWSVDDAVAALRALARLRPGVRRAAVPGHRRPAGAAAGPGPAAASTSGSRRTRPSARPTTRCGVAIAGRRGRRGRQGRPARRGPGRAGGGRRPRRRPRHPRRRVVGARHLRRHRRRGRARRRAARPAVRLRPRHGLAARRGRRRAARCARPPGTLPVRPRSPPTRRRSTRWPHRPTGSRLVARPAAPLPRPARPRGRA